MLLNDLVIPDIICPFPSLTSPHLAQVQTHAWEWLNTVGLIPQGAVHSAFLTSDIPWMICSIYPHAGLEELCLCSDWYIWGFSVDDLCDNSEVGTRPDTLEQIHADLMAVFQDAPLASMRESTMTLLGPLASALADTWQRAKKLTSTTWQQRFALHHADYFAGQLQEAKNRLHQQIPNIQEHITNRRSTSFSTTSMDLIELVHHFELPVEVYESQPFQALLNSMYDIVGWTNDVYSLPKELAHGALNNLVVVVQHEERCSLQNAVNRVCAMIDRETRHFQELVRCLPPYPAEVDRALRIYLADMGHYIRTALDYERTGSRYQGQTKHPERATPG